MMIISRWIAATILVLAANASVMAQDDDQSVMRGTHIVGMKVQADSGERLGTIDNIAIDVTNGKAIFAIIDSSNVPGVKDKLTAVPFPSLKFPDSARDHASLDITPAKFDEQSPFNREGWNTIGDRSWGKILYRTWGLEDQWSELTEKTGDKPSDSDQAIKPEVGPDGKPRLPLVKITDIIGQDVRTNQREDIGKVEDLALDTRNDKVVYAVLSTGGIASLNGKLVAVPVAAVNFNKTDKTLVVRVDRNKIKNAPAFDKKDWPDMADARWSKKVRDYYGVGSDDVVYGYAGEDSDRTMRGWEVNGPYNRKFDPAKIETINGKITTVERVVPMSGMSPAVELKVQQDNNQTVTVHLGPTWFLDRQANMFRDGDQVRVTGSRVDIDGKPIVMATEVERGSRIMLLRHRNGDPVWDAWSRSTEIHDRE